MEKSTASTSTNVVNEFLKLESAGGILLIAAAVLALVLSNSPLRPLYELLLSTHLEVRLGELGIDKPLLLWINDGLMAIFFFLVGLELKREMMEGQLADRRNIILPGLGALGGMLVPAAIYWIFNSQDPIASRGWAIPAATDIAFALGVLSLLGSRVPTSIKIFLTSLAIFDDIGAIIIIAIFYTAKISTTALTVVSVCVVLLFILNRRQVVDVSPYVVVGAIMWFATVKSGVHATLAGAALALFIPMRAKHKPEISPVRNLEHDLHPLVSFFILPVFAFANSGINFSGMGLGQLLHSVPVGIAAGLFIGKQLGVFGVCWLAVRLGVARLPKDISWASLYGVAALCGIGFTMSLFIGGLSFEQTGVDRFFDERLGIIVGSLASGALGFFILNRSLKH